jgi:glyoxylase-like metal-dependent hydrolase (beta-lactamase superfamily II)
MHFQIGTLRFDVLDDGLFELRPETFVKVTKNRNTELLDQARYRPRIKVGFNSLLIRGEGKTVLIDPGTGDKERIAERRNYNLDWPRKVLPKLRELGLRPDQIDIVILTHLHWDHAGAATTVGHGGQIVPTFSKARVLLHRLEVPSAREALNSGDDGYSADDFEPLVSSGKVEMLGDEEHVLPWLQCLWSGGHTAGHMVVRIGFPERPKVAFLSDLLPTSAQLPLDSGMSYDQYPTELAQAKQKFLSLCADEKDLAVLVHAPRNKLGYIRRDQDGTFHFEHCTVEQL